MRMKSRVTSSLALALAAAITMPPVVLAMQADTTETESYGQSGDWTLRRTIANGNEVVACDAFLITDMERGLRFAYDASGASLGFSGFGTAAVDGPMTVTAKFAKSNYTETLQMTLVQDSDGFPWRTYAPPNTEPDSILDDVALDSTSVTFSYDVPGEGRQDEVYEMPDFARVSQKTIDCVNSPAPVGKAKAKAKTEPKAEPKAAAASGPKVIKGSCKLVVDGKTYLNIKKNCSIWMANDGTGSFWINTDRDTFLGDYFAEIVPAGDGTASGNWNAEKGSTHAQAFLGEDFRMKKGGCWTNKRATICAAK
jgi:hypothetical protein